MNYEAARSNYRINREAWRIRSMAEFEEGSKVAGDLQRECDEYVAKVALDLSGAAFPATEEGKYLVYLLTSFTRSQMCRRCSKTGRFRRLKSEQFWAV